jgi:hypothetical protein
MSLINEALKRANDARPLNPPDGSQLPPMRPVVAAAPPALWPLLMVPLVLFLVFCLALWFLWRGWQILRRDRVQQIETVVAARAPAPEPVPPPVAKLPAHAQPRIEPAKMPALVSTPDVAAPVSAATSRSVSNIIVTPPLSPPDSTPAPFKLQAIFYRPDRPSVIINAQTLRLGEFIGDAKLAAISRNTATLVQAGKTNVLTVR